MAALHIPQLSPALPRRGNALTRAFGRLVLSLLGWHIEGEFPDRGKLVCIVAPHTSNWDFVIGLAAVFALGLDIRWLGKHTLFRGPAGPLMRWLGGIPVDRRSPHGYITQLTRAFHEQDRFLIGIAPEGTRRRVERWRTGFYFIAESAGVPIVLCYLDYVAKVAGIGPVVVPTGSLEQDLRGLMVFYRGVRAKRPACFNPDIQV